MSHGKIIQIMASDISWQDCKQDRRPEKRNQRVSLCMFPARALEHQKDNPPLTWNALIMMAWKPSLYLSKIHVSIVQLDKEGYLQ